MRASKKGSKKSQGSSAKTTMGLWIDHREAVLVFISSEVEIVKTIHSDAEKHAGRINGMRSTVSYESLLVPADDRRQNALTRHLNSYYDWIIAFVRDIDSILIFGPGEAKTEFKKRLEKNKLGNRIVAVQTAGKMTERQIAAKVRAYFKK